MSMVNSFGSILIFLGIFLMFLAVVIAVGAVLFAVLASKKNKK